MQKYTRGNVQGLYICVIIDLFSRKIIAHGISPKNSTYLVSSTFKKALIARDHPQGMMFHSDRGTQYTSKTFQNLLQMNKVVQSLSNPGMPHDNAVAESFFATMKKEELYCTRYRSVREISKSIDEYVWFYNTERPHSTLAYKTPVKYEALCGNADL